MRRYTLRLPFEHSSRPLLYRVAVGMPSPSDYGGRWKTDLVLPLNPPLKVGIRQRFTFELCIPDFILCVLSVYACTKPGRRVVKNFSVPSVFSGEISMCPECLCLPWARSKGGVLLLIPCSVLKTYVPFVPMW